MSSENVQVAAMEQPAVASEQPAAISEESAIMCCTMVSAPSPSQWTAPAAKTLAGKEAAAAAVVVSSDLEDSEKTQLTSETEEESTPEKTLLDWSFLANGQLYGRQEELAQLRQAFYRRLSAAETSTELVLISGNPGEGKTVLAKAALQDLATQHGGFFVMGKFDQLQRPDPYAPLVDASRRFFH